MNKIEKLRKRLGLTQAEFAKLLGITQATVSRLEQGLRAPSKPVQIILASLAGAK